MPVSVSKLTEAQPPTLFDGDVNPMRLLAAIETETEADDEGEGDGDGPD